MGQLRRRGERGRLAKGGRGQPTEDRVGRAWRGARQRKGGRSERAWRGGRRNAERGFVLLDVLSALAIALIGLSVFFGGLAGVARLVARQGERVMLTLEQRSSDAESRTVTFQGK